VLERDLEQSAEVRVELRRAPFSEELLEPATKADANAELRLVAARADPLAAQKVAERPVRQRLTVRDATAFQPGRPVTLGELA
jgi:hypothetical protein